MTLPHSPACERNREPILQVLRMHLHEARRVLEIGSGTGQHAAYFAQGLPHLQWQPSDQPPHLEGIAQWVDEAALPNLHAPLPLSAQASPHPLMPGGLASDPDSLQRLIGDAREGGGFDAVFTANTLHIMSWPQVEALFAGLPTLLRAGEVTLVVYGPFNEGGEYTSDSNREFDGWLKARDPDSGIRDFEAVDTLARGIGFTLLEDVAMPANNHMLVWRRSAT